MLPQIRVIESGARADDVERPAPVGQARTPGRQRAGLPRRQGGGGARVDLAGHQAVDQPEAARQAEAAGVVADPGVLAVLADPPHEQRGVVVGHDLRGVEVRALVHRVRALGDEAQRSALVDEVAHGRDDVAEHTPIVQGHDEHPAPVEGEQLGALPDVGPADRREDRVVGEEYPLVAPGELVAAVEQGDGGRAVGQADPEDGQPAPVVLEDEGVAHNGDAVLPGRAPDDDRRSPVAQIRTAPPQADRRLTRVVGDARVDDGRPVVTRDEHPRPAAEGVGRPR